jgi:hypothetical protein
VSAIHADTDNVYDVAVQVSDGLGGSDVQTLAIRDFRGAMVGRADKGLLFTTVVSLPTQDAQH